MTRWETVPRAANYEVSDDGRVRSKPRQGTKGGELKASADVKEYPTVQLYDGGDSFKAPVHALVLEAFVGPRPEGMVCRHLDGDPTNNTVENLAWGTHSENQYDKVEHGRHHNVGHWKTHCKYGHEFTDENTIWREGDTRRECRECSRRRCRETYRRRKQRTA